MHEICQTFKSRIEKKYPFCYNQYFKDYWLEKLRPSLDQDILLPEHIFELYQADALIFGIRIDYQLGLNLLPYAFNFYLTRSMSDIDQLDHSFAVFEMSDFLCTYKDNLIKDNLQHDVFAVIESVLQRLISGFEAEEGDEPHSKSVYSLGDWLQGLLSSPYLRPLGQKTIDRLALSKNNPLYSINLLSLLVDPLVDEIMILKRDRPLVRQHLACVESSFAIQKPENKTLLQYIRSQLGLL